MLKLFRTNPTLYVNSAIHIFYFTQLEMRHGIKCLQKQYHCLGSAPSWCRFPLTFRRLFCHFVVWFVLLQFV